MSVRLFINLKKHQLIAYGTGVYIGPDKKGNFRFFTFLYTATCNVRIDFPAHLTPVSMCQKGLKGGAAGALRSLPG